MSNPLTIILALLIFALMVIVHEFGHFAVAKLFKIRVVEFAVGMGPAIFKRKFGETTYALRCIPLGGYCMFDEDVGNGESERAFKKAAWYKRLCVILAGAFLNIVLGFLTFVIIQSATPQTYTPQITELVAHSNMADSAFQVGDTVIRLNNTDVHIKSDIDSFMQLNGDKPVLVTAKRGNEIIQDTIVPTKVEYHVAYGEKEIEIITFINGVQTQSETQPAPDDPDYAAVVGTTGIQTQNLLGFQGTVSAPSFGSVLHDAFYETIFNVKMVYQSLFMLLRGEVGADQVSGPIGVVNVIGQATQYGWLTVLSLLGLLTVNLGVMNLLPIPGLDGCKAITTVIEGITKRTLSEKAETVINVIGFAILILLMLWATFNDIQNIFIK